MTESNPWISQPSRPTAALAPLPATSEPAGPVRPQRGIPAPESLLPVSEHGSSAVVNWLGVHGGSGESSLASLVPEWAESNHTWPRSRTAAPAQVVLVARTSMRGLRAARAAATQWASGAVPTAIVLGLVLVADAPGRLPRPLREFATLVSGGVPRAWSVPWIESWRLGEPPALDTAPRDVRRLIDELHTITGAAGATI